jgi:hypothetical protein
MAGYISPQELERRKRQQEEESGLLDSIGRGLREAFVRDQSKYPTTGRRIDFSGVSQRDRERMAAEQKKRESSVNKNVAPGMGSEANIDRGRIGKGSFTANTPPKRATKPPVARNTTSEYVAPPSPESAQTAGIQGLPGTPGGAAVERGNVTSQGTTQNYETMFPAETFNPPSAAMRKGLFGEDISQEDYDAMTQRNKDASFFGRFKKGGQVKKKTAKKASGGSVSSASKRGDGCCQRGKTKGRMV